MEPTPKHMPLPEWDKKVAPLLNAIGSRSRWLKTDSFQVRDYVQQLAAVPAFDAEAMERMKEARDSLEKALTAVTAAIDDYNKKEKVI